MRDDEAYIHFQECLTDLNASWRIIEDLQGASIKPVLWAAAYHMALIEYAKPFRQSRGTNKRKHVLSPPALSEPDMKLHAKLLDLRDTVLAHSDLSVKDAKVYVGEITGQPLLLTISNTEPQLPELAVVKVHIERMLDALQTQLPGFEQQYRT